MSRLISEEAFEQLIQERDEARTQCAEWEKLAQTAVALNDGLNKTTSLLQAQCEEMRHALVRLVDTWDKQSSTWPIATIVEQARKALSSDCGKGLIPVSELEPSIEFLESIAGGNQPRLDAELARLKKLKGE